MRELQKALRRLEGTMFEWDGLEPPYTVRTTQVPLAWLLLVVEALAEFVHNDEWMPER